MIHPTAIVEPDAVIGEGTRIWHFAHVRSGAVIGAECVIGKAVYIDAGVAIGDRVKIQNGCSVYHGVTLMDEVFVGPHVTFTNDLHPRAIGSWSIVATRIEHGASIGAHATVVCGITIGAYAMVAAGAVVTTSVPPYGLVRGNPARLVGYVCRQGHSLTQQEQTPSRLHYRCPMCGDGLQVSYDRWTSPS